MARSARRRPIDRELAVSTLQDLVRIDSRNPGLESDAPGEWEIAEYVREFLEGIGWEVGFHDLGGRRANVVARREATGRGRSLMINVHLDTVGVSGMEDPFSGELRDGRVWGRGAQDTKGGMAAVLAAARALGDDEVALGGDLVLAFVADEEHESIGTTDLLRHVKTDGAIVIEPSDLAVCVAHRGLGVFRLRTEGRTAHGGLSDVGIDANLHMGHVLVELDALRRRWEQDHRHPMLGGASLHVPLVSGGRHLFVYSNECTVDVECRTVPGQSEEGVLEELEALLEAVRERIDDFRASIEAVLWRPPYEIDRERPIARAVLGAVEAVRGAPGAVVGHSWWEDSGLLGAAGIETVILGPTGAGLHTESEWVEAESVVDLAEVLYRSALSYCGGS